MPTPGHRAIAKAAGEARYFTGEACVRGHISSRTTCNGRCDACRDEDAILNCDKRKEYERAYHITNREHKCAVAKAWADSNPERNRKRASDWVRDNKEGNRLHSWVFRQRHPEKASEAIRLWAEKNPLKTKLYRHKRRALKMGSSIGAITTDCLSELRINQGDVCPYCATSLNGCGELDHIVALAVGGPHTISNLQWTCSACNRQKNTKTDAEFRAYQARLKNVDKRPLRSARRCKVASLACDV